MKLICTKAFSLFGTKYARGDSVDVTEEAAARLIRSGDARPALGEVSRYLSGMRCTTPAGRSDMRVHRR
jgi:hypothetical protein